MRKIVPACAFYSDLETGADQADGNAGEIADPAPSEAP